MYCRKCGAELLADSAFCHRCGTAVAQDQAAPPAPPLPTPAPTAAPGPVPTPTAAQVPSPVPTPAAAVPTLTLPTQPTAPAYAPGAPTPAPVATAHDNAQAGPNVVSYTELSAALDVLSGVLYDAAHSPAAGVDAGVAQSLYSKVYHCAEHLKGQHGAADYVGQAMNWMKQAGQALAKGKMPGASPEQFRPETWLVTLELDAVEAALYNRCIAQADLREHYETRALRTCMHCRTQRIVNPDYERIMRQRQQISTLMMPRAALLALYRMKKDPKFVCGRCQGMDYMERTIVLCPRCGEPNPAIFLGACPKCGLDMSRPESASAQPASPAPAATPAPPVPEPAPPASAAAPTGSRKMLTGKCVDCGNTFRVPLDMVPEGGVKANCKQCGRVLIIRRPKTQT